MTQLKALSADTCDAHFETITPESAQRDIEQLLAMKPSDPDYDIFFGNQTEPDRLLPLILIQTSVPGAEETSTNRLAA